MREISTSMWTRRRFGKAALAMSGVLASQLRRTAAQAPVDARVGVSGPDSLRAHAALRGMMYGAAVIPALLDVEGVAAGGSKDPYTLLVSSQTNILVAENAMKWAALRPSADSFDFAEADRLMRFAALSGQRVRGHNLCWHEALPAWFKATATTANARTLLTEHIQKVAGRYRNQIHSWDVVNEAVNPKDGRPDGLRASPWLELAGPDYIELAFKTAAAADPTAKLTYNDYDIELDTPEQSEKRGQVMLLIRRLKARNVPIQAVGVQSHLKADGPMPGTGLLQFIRDMAKIGIEVFITEMDVNTVGVGGAPELQDAAVANVYRDYLGKVLGEPNVSIALTWGITSAHTWLNESKEPWAKRSDGLRQRTLPFDDDMNATRAFRAIRDAIDATKHVTPVAPLVLGPAGRDPGGLYKPFPVQGSPTNESPASQPPKPATPPAGPF